MAAGVRSTTCLPMAAAAPRRAWRARRPTSRRTRCAMSSNPGIRDETVDPFGGRGHAHALRARQPVGAGIDADERAHLELPRRAQHLDHQIRADVAAADDRDFDAH